jgi:DNA-directed RNA polymerase subunit RPC12/RpoP
VISYILVLCGDCKSKVLTAKPKVGTAKSWDGLLICDDCGAKRLSEMSKRKAPNAEVSADP